MRHDAIIVGGGIAGITAAIHLAEAGVRVLLLETRKKLGGRATSFTDVRTGEVIDNCQHVAMRCCTNYLDLCRRLDVLDQIEWRKDVYWVEAGGRTSVIRPGLFPAPGHFTGSFLGIKFLTTAEKVALARAMLAVISTDRARERSRTFGQWLAEQRQPSSLISKFWSPVIVSACNLDVDRVCAASALHVFQEGFLAHRDAAMVGVSKVPLLELYDRAEEVIASAGGEMRLGDSVQSVREREVVTSDGRTLAADRVILSVPPERAARMVDPGVAAKDARFARLGEITHSPILGVHMTFDRPVLPMHSAVLVERPTQWVFRKDAEGRKLHAVISAADEWVPMSEQQVTERVMSDLRACFPQAADAMVLSSRPVKEKLATFAPTPEVEAVRPTTVGASALILAGDYVQTGWPATMEGAARSGMMAAAAALGRETSSLLVASLPVSPIYAAMAP